MSDADCDPDPDIRFDGKVALVTGSGRGIGREEALLLASRGARVVVNDWGRASYGESTGEAVADGVVAEIRAAGGEAVADTLDVGTVEGATGAVEHALDEWGRIDVLINNAGAFARAESPDDMTDAGIELTVRTHLLSTMWTCRRAWTAMAAQGSGRIVNTSSATMLGVRNTWDYPATKGGVLGFSRSLAVTGKPIGILVNTIMPMAYTRSMHNYPDEEVRRWMEAAFPPAQIAPLVAYLAHDEVPCTGECFAVGAGRAARIVMMAAPGYQKEGAGTLAIEEVRDHWNEVMDVSEPVLLRHSRDESAMYRGPATWSGSNAGYDEL